MLGTSKPIQIYTKYVRTKEELRFSFPYIYFFFFTELSAQVYIPAFDHKYIQKYIIKCASTIPFVVCMHAQAQAHNDSHP